jgi:hypothetical protein
MSKRVITKDWSAIPAADQAYLRASYDRYKSRFLTPEPSSAKNVSFERWLSKRGIQQTQTH